MASATAEAIAALVAAAGPGSGSPLVAVELRHLGGALSSIPAGHGALDAVDQEFLLFAVGVVADAEAAMTIDAALAGRFYDEYTLHRLRRVKARVDGDELFVANHPV